MVPQIANILIAPDGFEQIRQLLKNHRQHIIRAYRTTFHTILYRSRIALIDKRAKQPIPNDEYARIVAINLFFATAMMHTMVRWCIENKLKPLGQALNRTRYDF